ncbi:MAG: hypothetical protein JSS69_02415 [Acidobacteria bacterium]|nr:hypothetical protein [Acidobacteriota bacterium]MBS1864747.1 hypothetical protein [Acidobacteriota bacterium]
MKEPEKIASELFETHETKCSPEEASHDRSDLRLADAKFPRRDPEDRTINVHDIFETRDKMFDKTVADSFPASDPPSTLPDPTEDSFRPASE